MRDRSVPFVQLQKCKRGNTINTGALCAESTTILGNRDVGTAVEIVLCVGEGDETHEANGEENDEIGEMHLCRSDLCLGGRFRSWGGCLDYRRFELDGREFADVEGVFVVKSRGVVREGDIRKRNSAWRRP